MVRHICFTGLHFIASVNERLKETARIMQNNGFVHSHITVLNATFIFPHVHRYLTTENKRCV
jgi:hypothetical protein